MGIPLLCRRALHARTEACIAVEGARSARDGAQQAVWHARRLRAEVLMALAIFRAGGPMLPRSLHGAPWERDKEAKPNASEPSRIGSDPTP